MPPRLFPLFALALALAGCERPAAAVASPPPDAAAGSAPEQARSSVASPAGAYAMQGDRRATLTLAPAGAGWRVSLKGGSSATDGAAAAADCEIEAEGPLNGRTINARVVPFEGTNLSVSAQNLAARPAGVKVDISPNGAIVGTDFQGCGVGADLSGRYARAGTTPKGAAVLQPGASVADLRAAYPDARLEIVEGYPWARFAIRQGGHATAIVTFDGENEELADGRNSIQAIGAVVGWDALKPALRVAKVEGTTS
jgi:putative hemolysin